MKKIWIYLLGVVTGIVVTFIVLFIIGNSNNEHSPDGMEFFKEAGEVMECSSYQVFQALSDGCALAWESDEGGLPNLLGAIVLLYNEEGSPYYDRQTISASHEECFRQVGIFRYKNGDGNYSTVPIIMLMKE
ncbi:MAG: hypothetical protein IJ785_04740 [Bacteroidales bacterium]|nr:hypothetical protein [Bacteroidales bacterium]